MKEKSIDHELGAELRESVRVSYSGRGDEYDIVRGDEAGRLLSEYDTSIIKEIIPFINEEKTQNLEVGCGTGRFTIPLLAMGYRVIATDINDSLLQQLRNKLDTRKTLEQNCIVKVENGFSLSYGEGDIDGLLCIHVIPRFETKSDQLALLEEFSRVIKPGGKVLFNFSNKKSLLYGRSYRGHLIAYDEIINELPGLGFKVISVRGKWLVNATLLRAVPRLFRRVILRLDQMMLKFWSSRAWDVFILAERI